MRTDRLVLLALANVGPGVVWVLCLAATPGCRSMTVEDLRDPVPDSGGDAASLVSGSPVPDASAMEGPTEPPPLDAAPSDLSAAAVDVRASDSCASSPKAKSGRWSGMTSQGLALSFILDGGVAIDEWEYGWRLPMCASSTKITFSVPVPISCGEFMRVVPAPGGLATTFAGHFLSDTLVEGTVKFVLSAPPIPGSPPGCSGHDEATFTARAP